MLKLFMVQSSILPVFVATDQITDTGTASIATLIVQLGLSGVFLYLYQQERKERIRVSDQAMEIAKLSYPLLSTVAKSLENVDQSTRESIQVITGLKR